MNLQLSPEGETRLAEQRIQYLASMPRKIECLKLLMVAWERKPESPEPMSAIMAMVHQLCGSAPLYRCDSLHTTAEQCRDLLETLEPAPENANTILGALLEEMRLLDETPET